MNSAVGSGSTLEGAVEDALVRLGAQPEQVTLKKLEEGGPAGLMGLSARPFRVRATWRPEFAPPPPPPPHPSDRTAFRGEGYSISPTIEPPHRAREERGPRRERPERAERGERGGRRERGERGGRFERGPRTERAERPERPRRPSPPHEPAEPMEVDAAFLEKVRNEARWLLDGMGLSADVAVSYDGEEVTVALTTEEDEALLTGRRGETRISLQQILSRIANPRRGPGAHVVVDVNGYLAGRRADLLARARELAREAIASGAEQLTEPLSSEDRRAVHRALTKDGGVITESYGDGALKRIAIRPSETA